MSDELDRLVKLGHIRPHIADHIRQQYAAAGRSMEKTAYVAQGAGNVAVDLAKKFAIGVGLLSGAGLTIQGANKGISAISNAISKSGNFSGMMEANPDLKQLDRVKVQRAFNTLQRFNPEMAGDPMVAGTFVKRTADFDMIDHKTVGELSAARKNMAQARQGEGFSVAGLGAGFGWDKE